MNTSFDFLSAAIVMTALFQWAKWTVAIYRWAKGRKYL